jgi:hypothetical protein
LLNKSSIGFEQRVFLKHCPVAGKPEITARAFTRKPTRADGLSFLQWKGKKLYRELIKNQ